MNPFEDFEDFEKKHDILFGRNDDDTDEEPSDPSTELYDGRRRALSRTAMSYMMVTQNIMKVV